MDMVSVSENIHYDSVDKSVVSVLALWVKINPHAY